MVAEPRIRQGTADASIARVSGLGRARDDVLQVRGEGQEARAGDDYASITTVEVEPVPACELDRHHDATLASRDVQPE